MIRCNGYYSNTALVINNTIMLLIPFNELKKKKPEHTRINSIICLEVFIDHYLYSKPSASFGLAYSPHNQDYMK